ncbi:MAG: oligosaccharide flippase family protein [Bacteroidetes bacterium]|nr:oligosaccharide flippase family protein [Bacteroidota bacterium]
MNIKTILKKKAIRDFSAIAGATLALKPIGFIKSFLVAKYLEVYDYGLLNGVNLLRDLAKYGSLGFKTVATRDVLELKGTRTSKSEIDFIKNNSYTYEFALSLLLFIAGLVCAFFYLDNLLVFYSVILASFGLLFLKLLSIIQNEAKINKNFILISKVTLVSGLLTAVLVSALVPFLRIYASLIIPTLASILSIYMYSRSVTHKFHFVFDKKEFFRQLKIGFPISMATVAYGSYVYIEKIAVIGLLGLFSAGLFGFGQMILSHIVTLFLMPIRVRGVVIYENLGAGNYSLVNKIVIRETFFLLALSFVSIIIIWFSLDFFVPKFLPKYNEAIPIAKLLVFVLPFKVIGSYALVVLASKTVNKQNIIPFVQLGAALLLVAGVYLLKLMNLLTLYSFIIVDLIGYGSYHLVIFYLYFKFYYNKYVRLKGA